MSLTTRPPIGRIVEINYLLSLKRYPNAARLSERFEVAIRTIYRDIDYMKNMLGSPIEFDRLRNGYYYSEEGYILPIMKLTQGELVAVFIAEKVLSQYSGTPYYTQLKSAFEKICSWLPEEVSVNLSRAKECLSFQLGPVREVEIEIFEKIIRSIAGHKKLRMKYFTQSRGELTERLVDPYHILNYGGDWYLIAFCHSRMGVRDFAISRIRFLEEIEDSFRIKDCFDLKSYLKSGFGIEKGAELAEAKILFDAYQARWIREKRWSATEEKHENPDKSLTLTMLVPITGEFKRWILSFGSHAVVQEPDWFKDELTEEVGRMKKNYSSEIPEIQKNRKVRGGG